MSFNLNLRAQNGGLSSVTFGPNELVSALTLSKAVCSIFSLEQDAVIFDILTENFHVKVNSVPLWLQNFGLVRATKILRFNMQPVEGPHP